MFSVLSATQVCRYELLLIHNKRRTPTKLCRAVGYSSHVALTSQMSTAVNTLSQSLTHQSVCRLDRAAYRHQRDIISHGSIDMRLSNCAPSSPLSSSSTSSADCDASSSWRRRCCFPLPLATQRDVTVTSLWVAWPVSKRRGGARWSPLLRPPAPQRRMSRAPTTRQLLAAPTSDDVTMGDVRRRDVSRRPCSVSLMASSMGNVRCVVVVVAPLSSMMCTTAAQRSLFTAVQCCMAAEQDTRSRRTPRTDGQINAWAGRGDRATGGERGRRGNDKRPTRRSAQPALCYRRPAPASNRAAAAANSRRAAAMRAFIVASHATCLAPHAQNGASAVKQPSHSDVTKSSNQARSPGVPDAAKRSPNLKDLTNLSNIAPDKEMILPLTLPFSPSLFLFFPSLPSIFPVPFL